MDTDGSSLSPYLWACDELTNAKKKSKEILLLHILNQIAGQYTRAYTYTHIRTRIYVRTYTIGDNAHFIKGGGAGPSPVPLLHGTGPHYLSTHARARTTYMYIRIYIRICYTIWVPRPGTGCGSRYVSMRLPDWRSVLGTAAATLGAAIWYVILEELSDMLQ